MRVGEAVSIYMLPDDVLLEIFDFYVDKRVYSFKKRVEVWQTLVHVCRRWRRVVFGSPRRLNLRLVCTWETPARDMLDVWPSLPLLLQRSLNYGTLSEDTDNIIAVLERSNRVVKIDILNVNRSENVLAAMQVPFPELTDLILLSDNGTASVLPDSFLGGSAPRLRYLSLYDIPFPGLPKLLLSATHLVTLRLWHIPHSGYISPEAMATALSTLTRLDDLELRFESPRSCPDSASRRLPPPTRSVLPVLTYFLFKGVCDYLEDLVAYIDAPRLNKLEVTFFNQIVFDTPQFIQFISRTPKLETFEKANVVFRYGAEASATVHLLSRTSGHGHLTVTIPCTELDWQVSSMEQVCTLCLPPLSTLEDIYIYESRRSQPDRQDNIENMLWLELLHPFTSAKYLYLSKGFASRIGPALQELVGGRATEVLPTLQNIFLERLQPSGTVRIQQFVAARRVTSHPIAVSHWDRDRAIGQGTGTRRLTR
jgi:hypothetical protein